MTMENVRAKLVVLQYDDRLDPLSFVLKQQPQQQLDLFLEVASWLLSQCVAENEKPREKKKQKDPLQALESLLAHLAKLLPPTEQERLPAIASLQQGYGEDVCKTLDMLCDAALRKRDFKWQSPVYLATTKYQGEQQQEKKEEQRQEKKHEEEEEKPMIRAEAKQKEKKEESRRKSSTSTVAVAESKTENQVDKENESKEQRFRERLDQVKNEIKETQGICQAKEANIDAMRKELAELESRHQSVQQEEEHFLALHNGETTAIITTTSSGASSSSSNPSMVARIKSALQALKEEGKGLDVRVGVLQYILLQQARNKRGVQWWQQPGAALHRMLQRGDTLGLEEDEESDDDFFSSSPNTNTSSRKKRAH